jgi:hypothetical protein
MSHYPETATLLLRFSIAYVFLYAAWQNTRNAAAWKWTVGETALLFRWAGETERPRLAFVASITGMIMMYFGGLSLVAGAFLRADSVIVDAFLRAGGAAIALFSVMGMAIHRIRREEALVAAKNGDAMGWSAYSAHVAAGLKNIALAGGGAYFALAAPTS